MDIKLKNCNFIKMILMLSVVLYHSVLFWNGKWFATVENVVYPSQGLNLISQVLKTFHVSGFTLVSGYIFGYIRNEKKGYNKFLPFIRKKFIRLILPYFFVSAFWVVPVAIYFFKYDFNVVFQRYVLMSSPNQLWFLVMLFNVFCMAFLMADIWKEKRIFGFLLVVFLYVVGCVCERLFLDVFQIWTACMFLAYFWLGFYLRLRKNAFFWKIPSLVYVLGGVIAFLCLKMLENGSGLMFEIMVFGLNHFLGIYGALAAFILLQRLAGVIRWDNRVFGFISGKNMIIYLFHQQFIYFTLRLLNGLVGPWLHACINFVFSLGCSLLLALLIQKSRVLSFLVGEPQKG